MYFLYKDENKNQNRPFDILHLRKMKSIKAGDTVKVYYEIKEGEKKRIQSFQGIIIKKQGNYTLTIRKTIGTIGVERIFQMKSPIIKQIKKIMSGKVRRAKIYYFRKRIVKNRKEN